MAAQVAASAAGVRFVLVGQAVVADPDVRALLAETNLTTRFILEERRDDVQNIMSALDVFCLASKSEGFPNMLREGLRVRRPRSPPMWAMCVKSWEIAV